MGDHARRRVPRRRRRDEARATGFIDSLPKDGDWIAALRDQFPDEAGNPAVVDRPALRALVGRTREKSAPVVDPASARSSSG